MIAQADHSVGGRSAPGLHILELILIAIAALLASRLYTNPDRNVVLAGQEGEYLASAAYYAVEYAASAGRIPLWQPLLGCGEPFLENPYTFLFNPFVTLPVFAFGAELGVRYSAALHFILAGWGGWAAAKVMGLGLPARLLLGVLMALKGNMPGMLGWGIVGMGFSQAYLPWTLAGALAAARFRESRAPVVLLALSLTLLLFNGNIYFILPACIIAGFTAVVFCVRRADAAPLRLTVDSALFRRYTTAFILFAAMSAVVLIPVLTRYDRVGGHPDERPDAVYVRPALVITQFFLRETTIAWHANSHHYELYSVPIWFAAALFAIPPFARRWSRLRFSWLNKRVLLIALALGLFFLLWGTGTNPVMRWAYANLPLIGQWRFLSRLLTITSLFLVVVVALRYDSLWRALILDGRGVLQRGWRRLAPAAAFIAAGVLASYQMIHEGTTDTRSVYRRNTAHDACLAWLRAQHPGEEITIHVRDYKVIIPYLTNRIRFTYYSGDYQLEGNRPTIYPHDLRRHYAQYVLPVNAENRAFWLERGYVEVADAPRGDSGAPCLLMYPDALPYAFAAPLNVLKLHVPPEDPQATYFQQRGLPGSLVSPLPHYQHLNDVIALTVQPYPDQPTVVVVGDLAYPGWTVTVNGQPARLESVGQLLGVLLPAGAPPQQIVFRYEPLLLRISGAITAATMTFLALWLLQADRLLPRLLRRYRRREEAAPQVVYVYLGSPETVEPPRVLPFD